MSVTAALPTDCLFLEEHESLTLTTGPEQGILMVNGEILPRASLSPSSPYIETWAEGEVTINVHDWVGRLHLTSSEGFLDQVIYVYPSKLGSTAEQAFTALTRLVDSLPETTRLNYPTELVPVSENLRLQPLSFSDIEQVALRAWYLTREWKRRPRWTEGMQRRVVRGGAVPDRVDWALTLEEWGRGRFPDHVARDLPQAVLPRGLKAIRQLWETLIDVTQRFPEGSALAHAARQTLNELPQPSGAAEHERDQMARTAYALVESLEKSGRQSRQLPAGHAAMAPLYEFWVQASVLLALGATDGHFNLNSQGLYVGTFRGPDVTVTLNPRLAFFGVGQGQQFLMPDLLLEFDSGQCVVADVKYRALHRLPTEQIREVNRQLLTYMGLTHAATGVVLWPAMTGETLREEPLPSSRARLLRMRCHPLDPPEELASRLRLLNPTGVP
ncbi:hypothetical protein D3875_02075 [Deinococcus cavernae]|uniref:Uncharacterized protein n=1 Tax=Deinococcus cavernae TaxID=2320857 RepID=A0A418VH00_9DEIO|nr:hypothetical protein [Deinococcus cavernae]RJF75302.1 hypothetical protein D3875_02075 [Deinococcus cavernae]